ncbi:MAG: hypothetical protein KAJ58_00565 [Candidatus Pacebacteria bacterium]|nr:hypothetical protein [Candidatus Paceibacterota bacterium]
MKNVTDNYILKNLILIVLKSTKSFVTFSYLIFWLEKISVSSHYQFTFTQKQIKTLVAFLFFEGYISLDREFVEKECFQSRLGVTEEGLKALRETHLLL